MVTVECNGYGRMSDAKRFVNFMEEHARELLGMPPEWQAFRFEAKGPVNTPTDDGKFICVTGAVTPTVTQGKRRGCPNWRKRDKETEMTVTIPLIKHREWERNWETTNNKCFRCQGHGQEMAGWSVDEGTKYRPCPRCKATGVPTPNSMEKAD